MSDDQVLQAFKEHQQVRGLSPNTIRRRRYSLQGLAVFATPVPLLAVTPELIWDWLGTHKKAETRSGYLNDCRAFFRWARKRGLVLLDPTEDLERIKVPKHLPRPLDEQELALAIAMARDPRLRLVLILAAFAGLRISEVARLRGEDCTRRCIVVRAGKGNLDGTVPTHPLVWAALCQHGIEHGWLFESPYDGHLSPTTLGQWIRAHFDELGITGGLHRARHRFGTRVAEAAKGDLILVQELMRHATLETTRGYVAFDDTRLGPIVAGLPAAGQ